MNLDITDRPSVRVVEARGQWRCLACDIWTPVALEGCQGCGQDRTQLPTVVDDEAVSPSPLPGATSMGRLETPEYGAAVMRAVMLPSAGHVVRGRTMAGLTRMVIAVTTVLAMVVTLIVAGVLPA